MRPYPPEVPTFQDSSHPANVSDVLAKGATALEGQLVL
jgi:hypothetical protein